MKEWQTRKKLEVEVKIETLMYRIHKLVEGNITSFQRIHAHIIKNRDNLEKNMKTQFCSSFHFIYLFIFLHFISPFGGSAFSSYVIILLKIKSTAVGSRRAIGASLKTRKRSISSDTV